MASSSKPCLFAHRDKFHRHLVPVSLPLQDGKGLRQVFDRSIPATLNSSPVICISSLDTPFNNRQFTHSSSLAIFSYSSSPFPLRNGPVTNSNSPDTRSNSRFTTNSSSNNSKRCYWSNKPVSPKSSSDKRRRKRRGRENSKSRSLPS